ncbi:hypothetical protein FK425_RS08310 [Enterococcus hirae]
MKLQKLSDEVKAETKYCPFRLCNKETKIEAHEEMVSKECSIFGFFLPKSRKKCLLLSKYNIFNIIVTIDRVVFLNDILEG